MASLAMAFSTLDGGGRVLRSSRSIAGFRRSIGVARPCGTSQVRLRGLELARHRNAGGVARVAAEDEDVEIDDDEEDPQEEEGELMTLEQLREQQRKMQDIMKRKVRVHKNKFRKRELASQGTVEDEFFSILERVEPLLDEPSEGVKQLLAIIESSKAFDEPPPPKYRVPRWAYDVALVGGVLSFLFALNYVNFVLDEYDERKALEAEAQKVDKDKESERARKSVSKSLESEFDAAARQATRAESLKSKPEIVEKFYQVYQQTILSFQLWLQSLWVNIITKWKQNFS